MSGLWVATVGTNSSNPSSPTLSTVEENAVATIFGAKRPLSPSSLSMRASAEADANLLMSKEVQELEARALKWESQADQVDRQQAEVMQAQWKLIREQVNTLSTESINIRLDLQSLSTTLEGETSQRKEGDDSIATALKNLSDRLVQQIEELGWQQAKALNDLRMEQDKKLEEEKVERIAGDERVLKGFSELEGALESLAVRMKAECDQLRLDLANEQEARLAGDRDEQQARIAGDEELQRLSGMELQKILDARFLEISSTFQERALFESEMGSKITEITALIERERAERGQSEILLAELRAALERLTTSELQQILDARFSDATRIYEERLSLLNSTFMQMVEQEASERKMLNELIEKARLDRERNASMLTELKLELDDIGTANREFKEQLFQRLSMLVESIEHEKDERKKLCDSISAEVQETENLRATWQSEVTKKMSDAEQMSSSLLERIVMLVDANEFEKRERQDQCGVLQKGLQETIIKRSELDTEWRRLLDAESKSRRDEEARVAEELIKIANEIEISRRERNANRERMTESNKLFEQEVKRLESKIIADSKDSFQRVDMLSSTTSKELRQISDDFAQRLRELKEMININEQSHARLTGTFNDMASKVKDADSKIQDLQTEHKVKLAEVSRELTREMNTTLQDAVQQEKRARERTTGELLERLNNHTNGVSDLEQRLKADLQAHADNHNSNISDLKRTVDKHADDQADLKRALDAKLQVTSTTTSMSEQPTGTFFTTVERAPRRESLSTNNGLMFFGKA